ncbi:hypothetical protein CVT26_005964 [Gymnopilus dilepis]|uniref:Uncharacterized protein n=1 Tax=Gymnopilus dilepis TaxID=231916 RepID=A0A409Y1R3_9AGAR|nr:hypothetical protein CVT26_005964 [Gymnopilus dilepis]
MTSVDEFAKRGSELERLKCMSTGVKVVDAKLIEAFVWFGAPNGSVISYDQCIENSKHLSLGVSFKVLRVEAGYLEIEESSCKHMRQDVSRLSHCTEEEDRWRRRAG